MFLTRRPMPSLFSQNRGHTGNAFADFFQLQDELFKGWNNDVENEATPTRKSVLDVMETAAAYIVKANIPGVKAEELNVELEGRVLTFSTTPEESPAASSHDNDETAAPKSTDDEVLYLRRDRPQAAFHHSLELPEDLKSEAIEASLEFGVLTLTIPRRAAPSAQKIEVHSTEAKAA